MTTDQESKLAQFNEFFSIDHEFTVNVSLIAEDCITDFNTFLDKIPAPFLMATDIYGLDQSALKPLQALSGIAGQLVDYLNQQAAKIDLMMGYIIQQQDEQDKRYMGIRFGGGGFTFSSSEAFEVGQFLEVKIFIATDNCAVFCYGEIISCSESVEGDIENIYQVIYHFIRDEDRDLLVRASLHKQSKDLQLLAAKRRQEKTDP